MDDTNVHLHKNLKNRHIQMIALGGAIGTGLFYGSAETIQMVGPAITVSFLIGGIIIFFIMRALGEMLVYNPSSGSFSEYANEYWGHFPGFLAGWNYWFTYVIASMVELTVAGVYVNFWFPNIPTWLTSLVFLFIITLVNLIDVKFFGEFEFWFAIIKVVAIISMIILGTFLIFSRNIGVHNLWAHGGFAPYGIPGILFSFVLVIFSFGGVELIGTTAGETENPTVTIPKAINQVVFRVLIFYVGALLVMLSIFRWDLIGTSGSPFVLIFSDLGIPAAATILNVVVLTACLSTYNSALFSNGRMLLGLANQGNAPKMFSKLSKNGVPTRGVLFSSALTLLTVVLNYIMPGKVFMYLAAIATLAFVINWGMILIIQLKFRKKVAKEDILFKMPFFPYSTYLGLLFLATVTVLIPFMKGNLKYALIIMPIWILILYLGYRIQRSKLKKKKSSNIDINIFSKEQLS